MHILFDFDGTLVDSGALVFNKLQANAKNNICIEELRNLPSDQVIQYLGISMFKLPFLIMEMRAEIRRNITTLQLAVDMKETLELLIAQGHILHIASSNSTENINAFLTQHNISHFFSSISSLFTIFGKAKGLKKILKNNQISFDETLYIGDETRDIEAANQVKIKCCAVCWGYNSEEILKSYSPDFIAKTPQHLIATINLLNSL